MKPIKAIAVSLAMLGIVACVPRYEAPASASFEASSGQILEALSVAAPRLPNLGFPYSGWYVSSVAASVVRFQNNGFLFWTPVFVECTWASSSPTLTAVTCLPASAGDAVLNYLASRHKRL